jgi:hypothetical protein
VLAATWHAMKRVSAPLAGVLGLNEAVFASLIGALAFNTEIGVATLGAAALIPLGGRAGAARRTAGARSPGMSRV